MSERTTPILNPRTLAMLRWAFSLPPEDPDRDYLSDGQDQAFYYRARLELGRCGRCSKINDTPQFANCSACRDYFRKWRYQQLAGAPARCKDCSVIFEGGRRVCDRCAEKRRIAKRVRRARGVSHNSA